MLRRMSIVGERITELLAGRSQQWLADQVGMKQPGIQAIITGRVKRPKLLKEIATALCTSQEYLLGETDDPSPPETPVEKIPKQVLEAFEQIPGAPLTEDEIQLLLGQLRLIARSRKPHNGGNPDNGQQPVS